MVAPASVSHFERETSDTSKQNNIRDWRDTFATGQARSRPRPLNRELHPYLIVAISRSPCETLGSHERGQKTGQNT